MLLKKKFINGQKLFIFSNSNGVYAVKAKGRACQIWRGVLSMHPVCNSWYSSFSPLRRAGYNYKFKSQYSTRGCTIYTQSSKKFSKLNLNLKRHQHSNVLKNIPWSVTSSTLIANASLIRIYNWYLDPKNNSPIREFMIKHCSHLIIPVTKENPYFFGLTDSLISTTTFSFAQHKNMLKIKNLIDCKEGTELINIAKNKYDYSQSWIYCFIQKQPYNLSNHRIYIGSTISPLRRLRHYLENKGPSITSSTVKVPLSKVLKKRRWNRLDIEMNNMIGGFTNFYFFVGAFAPNYYNLWIEDANNFKLNLDPLSKLILDAVSEYHIKILEQATISFFNPEINDTKRSVSFNFINLNLDSLKYSNTQHCNQATLTDEKLEFKEAPHCLPSIQERAVYAKAKKEIKNKKICLFALDENGRTFASFTSKLQAAKELGITLSIISRNSNVEENYFYCPRPDKILLLIDPTKWIKQSKKPAYNFSLPIKGVDLLSLDSLYYYLILEDKKTCIGKYNSYLEISKVTNLPLSSGNAYTNNTRTLIFKQNEISNIFNDTAKDLANNILNKKGSINVFICCNPSA